MENRVKPRLEVGAVHELLVGHLTEQVIANRPADVTALVSTIRRHFSPGRPLGKLLAVHDMAVSAVGRLSRPSAVELVAAMSEAVGAVDRPSAEDAWHALADDVRRLGIGGRRLPVADARVHRAVDRMVDVTMAGPATVLDRLTAREALVVEVTRPRRRPTTIVDNGTDALALSLAVARFTEKCSMSFDDGQTAVLGLLLKGSDDSASAGLAAVRDGLVEAIERGRGCDEVMNDAVLSGRLDEALLRLRAVDVSDIYAAAEEVILYQALVAEIGS